MRRSIVLSLPLQLGFRAFTINTNGSSNITITSIAQMLTITVAVCQQIYHVGYTSSNSNTEVKQHWAWIKLGWETLQRISGSAGSYLPPPVDRVQSFQTLFASIKSLRPAETNKKTVAAKDNLSFVVKLRLNNFFCSRLQS